jgi:hypothetical protein
MATPLDSAARVPAAARRMADAARRWLDTLDAAQHARARFPFESDERYVWDYRPVPPRQGLALFEMTAAQRERAMARCSMPVSARAAPTRPAAFVALEPVLGEIERLAGQNRKRNRDPERYWFALFGEPDGQLPWAWRIGGHHVAVLITVVDAAYVAVTPLFFGANPATIPHGPRAGQRTLAAEEDLARELLASLTPAQKAVAIVDPAAPLDILTTNYRVVEPGMVPRGLAYDGLTGEQRERLARLVRCYVDRAAPDVAAVEWARVEAAGLDRVTFAWAGPEARGQAHYYAVCGPRFLIEYDNTQNDANHIHSVWRDFTNDWGEDLLAAHYAASHR